MIALINGRLRYAVADFSGEAIRGFSKAMSVGVWPVMLAAPQPSDPRPLERRRFERAKLVLLGRYMLSDHTEHPCWTVNISRVGMALEG
jgi:hypothetical protein